MNNIEKLIFDRKPSFYIWAVVQKKPETGFSGGYGSRTRGSDL